MAGIDWESIGRSELHPLRVRIIERAAADPEARFSPKQLADEWGVPLGNVSYHVSVLYGRGMLTRAGTGRARGARINYYRVSAKLLG